MAAGLAVSECYKALHAACACCQPLLEHHSLVCIPRKLKQPAKKHKSAQVRALTCAQSRCMKYSPTADAFKLAIRLRAFSRLPNACCMLKMRGNVVPAVTQRWLQLLPVAASDRSHQPKSLTVRGCCTPVRHVPKEGFYICRLPAGLEHNRHLTSGHKRQVHVIAYAVPAACCHPMTHRPRSSILTAGCPMLDICQLSDSWSAVFYGC